ncbi:MAG: Ig-like domain-containing protein [Clostridia bacterium]|nr:Ig-like domain-containing protein [Clostridia bacterium]
MKNKIIDIVSLCAAAALFGAVALLNILQTDRPTVSEIEQRNLAKMPEFSMESLTDGSYFNDLSLFFSDTFLYRDKLVGISKEIDTLKGLDYSVGDNFALIGTSDSVSGDEDAASAGMDKVNAALDSLLNAGKTEETEPADSAPDETVPEETTDAPPMGEIVEDTDHPETEATDPDEGFIITDDDTGETIGGTETPETESEEIISGETEPAESEPEETEPEPVITVTAIHLSKKNLNLTVGSGAVVYATVESDSPDGATVSWSISDKNVASISLNPKGGIDVKAVATGTCTLTCSYGDKLKESCEVKVTEINTTVSNPGADNADFLLNGMFIYGDAVYTQGFFSQTGAELYAKTALYYKQLFGEDVNVSVVVAPVSSIVVDNEEIQQKIPDQKSIFTKMEALMDDSINFVDVYSEMYDNRDEYLYFKSDHHWTQRGAYYAYRAFAQSIGLTPAELDDFDYEIRNDAYSGSMYTYTYDARVKNFVDIIEAFKPRKDLTMTITTANGATINYDTCIVNTNKTYVTFIAGDNPYTVINVPENPQDKNVLVLKDSFGNAFVPFLCEHFGNIIVVDVRHSSFNIYDLLKDYGLTDIVFMNNVQAANSAQWANMYLAAVGVN